MKFGVREICNVVFKAKAPMTIGTSTFKQGQPVLYIDTATASTLEQATTTVYAQGGRGNTRLITWEGEKTLTFTVTDALLSPIGLSILSGAGLFETSENKKVHVHTTAYASVVKTDGAAGYIDLNSALADDEYIDPTAPVFVTIAEKDGSLTGTVLTGLQAVNTIAGTASDAAKILLDSSTTGSLSTKGGSTVFVDFYITKDSEDVSEIQIDAASFGANFYVEASTLFRNTEGTDLPCEITLPNVKIQSNFTFSMASTGDPSTFDFTMDAMPDYTMFDKTHKVMCVMQVIKDAQAGVVTKDTVMGHNKGFTITESGSSYDSTADSGETTKD